MPSLANPEAHPLLRETWTAATAWQAGDYLTKWIYAQENPIRKKLVNSFEGRPFKGTIHQLLW